MTTASTLERVIQARARRVYERAMLRLGVTRASIVTIAVAALVALDVARLPSALWLLAIFALWLFMGWRGALLWRGALGGLVAGLGALALPMTILRPCCAAMTSATSCTRPELSIVAGVALGVVVTLTLPRLRSPAEWARCCAGALLAVASLVACRCTTLFLGESIGLLGGLLASAGAFAAVRAWWAARPEQAT
jgi:hypothetical protein